MRFAFAKSNAFSLVEVVIAIGIMTFAFLIILGLMSVGMHSGVTSRSDTAVGLLSNNSIAQLRMIPFANISAGIVTNYYFDAGGNAGSTNNNPAFSPFYRCTVTAVGDPATATAGTNNFFSVILCVAWPSPNYPNTNNIQASLANY